VSFPVREALAEYIAGRVEADRLIAIVAAAYYEGRGTRDALQPLMDLVERVAPGVVALSKRDTTPGFGLILAERPFPRNHEPELRKVAEETLQRLPDSPRPSSPVPPPVASPRPNFLRRALAAIQRLFSA
jgi:hypothetical protein